METLSSATHISCHFCKWCNSLRSSVSAAGAISEGIDTVLSSYFSFLVQSHVVKYAAVGFFLLLQDDCRDLVFSFPFLFKFSQTFAQSRILSKSIEPNVTLTLCFLPMWIPVGFFLPFYILCIPKCPTESDVLPCIFSASHQIFAGSERVSRWCSWWSQQCLGLQFKQRTSTTF